MKRGILGRLKAVERAPLRGVINRAQSFIWAERVFRLERKNLQDPESWTPM
jgi:hypothetical protein